MHVLTLLTTTATLLLPLTSSLPTTHTPLTSSSPLSLTRRAPGTPGGVYYCTDEYFHSGCTWQPPTDLCQKARANKADQSLGPDEGSWCTMYASDDCSDSSVGQTLTYPGLGVGLKGFGSFVCGKEPGLGA